MYEDGYLPPILTVDAVIFQIIDGEFFVMLIQRAKAPFVGAWALPGGYSSAGETTKEALARIVNHKAGLDVQTLPLIEQLYTFDTVARDPRGHAVSVTYMGLGRDLVPKEDKATQNPAFFRVSELPKLAYDHGHIIEYAHERLQAKLTYTNAVFALVPEVFTLSELQSAYETVFCRKFDKRNFRKKFLGLNLIHATNEYRREGAHRPAQLYKFNSGDLEVLSHSFD